MLALVTVTRRAVGGSAPSAPNASATSVAMSRRHSNDATQSKTLRDACLGATCSASSTRRTTSSAVVLPSPTHSLHTSQCEVHSVGARQISMPSITACTAGSIARERMVKAHPASSIDRC